MIEKIRKQLAAQEEAEGATEDVMATLWFLEFAKTRMQFSLMVGTKPGVRYGKHSYQATTHYKPTETLLGMYRSKIGEGK